MPDEGHYLDEYLSEILPKLGLDAETYGPYVTGFANDDDDTDEGMDDLIELLRASSESHGDDDALWQDFRNEILRRRKEFLDGEDTIKEQRAAQLQQEQSTSLQKEIELAQKNQLELAARKQHELESKKVENMSADRIALMAKFGYENDEDSDNAEEEEDDKPKTNREVAAEQNHLKNSRDLRSAAVQTKKDARAETKKAKELQAAKKEERRKRATKGERKR
ncbi:hypothetical protein ACHAWO_012554 [Cyclotella atomus]|uniref:Coiled-coil domain-containing protein 43 n=1 Tax=Cyclotella atomus TaxID=382360 RepID=A0ABD3NJ62_9STRA